SSTSKSRKPPGNGSSIIFEMTCVHSRLPPLSSVRAYLRPRRQMIRCTSSLLTLFTFAFAAAIASAQEAAVEAPRGLPPNVTLLTSKERQLVVVQAVYGDGITRDVSGQANWTLANPALVRRDGNTLWPAADGETQLTIEFGGKSLVVPVKVEKAAQPR